MKAWRFMTVCGLVMAGAAALSQAGENRLGVGANYWASLDDLNDRHTDDSGFSYLATYQYQSGLLGVEADVEFLPDRFGRDAWAPEAYLRLGGTLYAGVGIGIMNDGDEFADEPFYALKAGLDFHILPRTHLDICANYRFNDKAQLKDDRTNIDADTIFLGAAIRFTL